MSFCQKKPSYPCDDPLPPWSLGGSAGARGPARYYLADGRWPQLLGGLPAASDSSRWCLNHPLHSPLGSWSWFRGGLRPVWEQDSDPTSGLSAPSSLVQIAAPLGAFV